MAQRASYWSNSKLADFIRGSKKPGAETSKGWRDWEQASKEKHPIRYWIVEEGFDKVQNFLWWPIDKLHSLKYYVNNRWVTRTHALVAHPRDIKPGDWRDVSNRFLPCMFNTLVDFVEVEQAWHHVVWDKEARKKYKTPWYATGWFRMRTWRSPEAGLEHLYWAAGLTFDEDMGFKPGHVDYGKPTGQAESAKEILTLYHWWKNVYPKRQDPMEAGGWAEVCRKREERGQDVFDLDSETLEESQASAAALSNTQDIEKAYEREDEEMMIRLIKVRQSLWT